jgi:hypothetical protein
VPGLPIESRGAASQKFSEKILWFKIDFFYALSPFPTTARFSPRECDDDWTEVTGGEMISINVHVIYARAITLEA